MQPGGSRPAFGGLKGRGWSQWPEHQGWSPPGSWGCGLRSWSLTVSRGSARGCVRLKSTRSVRVFSRAPSLAPTAAWTPRPSRMSGRRLRRVQPCHQPTLLGSAAPCKGHTVGVRGRTPHPFLLSTSFLSHLGQCPFAATTEGFTLRALLAWRTLCLRAKGSRCLSSLLPAAPTEPGCP